MSNLPTTSTEYQELVSFRDVLKHVRPIITTTNHPEIKYVNSGQDELIPKKTCEKILSLEGYLLTKNPTDTQTKQFVRFLLGCYPSFKVQDPDVYKRSLVMVINKYPPEIIKQAIEEIVLNDEFPPNAAKINKAAGIKFEELLRLVRLAKNHLGARDYYEKLREEDRQMEEQRKNMDWKKFDEILAELRKGSGLQKKDVV